MTFRRQIRYKYKGFGAWAIFSETKGLSSFCSFFMVFSNVPSAEQGAEFVEKTLEFEDSQVESL